jgi:hypothetical protein
MSPSVLKIDLLLRRVGVRGWKAFRKWLVRNSNLRRISSKQGIAKVNG